MISDFKDIELIQQFLLGDIKSFELLVDKYQNYVYNTVMRLVINKEDATDLTEEIFIKLYTLLKDYNLKYNFKSWLYKISLNYSIDFLRNKKRDKSISTDPEKIYEIEKKFVQNKDGELIFEIEEVYRLIGKLSNKYREIILLRYFEGLDIIQISEILKINPKTVMVRLHRAIRFLQKKCETFS